MVWAFIFKSPKATHLSKSRLTYGDNTIFTCGVNTVEEGIQLIKELHNTEGCELVELCGGFGKEGACAVAGATGGLVRVGYVTKLDPLSEK